MEERDKYHRKGSRSQHSKEQHRERRRSDWRVDDSDSRRHHHHRQDPNEDFHYSRSQVYVPKEDKDRASTMRRRKTSPEERHDSPSRKKRRSHDSKRMLRETAGGDTKLKSKFEAKLERLRVNSRVPEPNANAPGITTTTTTAKLVEDIEKRKLIFGKKPAESSSSSSTPAGHSCWEQTKFPDDNDGKIESKFKRLMGMKSEKANPTEQSGTEKVSTEGKGNNEYLADLEKQYEVARTTNYTQRGLGLGFASRIDRQREPL